MAPINDLSDQFSLLDIIRLDLEGFMVRKLLTWVPNVDFEFEREIVGYKLIYYIEDMIN